MVNPILSDRTDRSRSFSTFNYQWDTLGTWSFTRLPMPIRLWADEELEVLVEDVKEHVGPFLGPKTARLRDNLRQSTAGGYQQKTLEKKRFWLLSRVLNEIGQKWRIGDLNP
jgi:hypothetical protein